MNKDDFPFDDETSHDKFDEMDELALSLQKQIRDLDNIPDFSSPVEDQPYQEEQEINHFTDDISDDLYEPSSSLKSDSSNEKIKQQIQKKLAAEPESAQRSTVLSLQFLIPIIIGLFFIVSSTTYWLLSEDTTNATTQNMEISLPLKPSLVLGDEPKMVSIDLETEASSTLNDSHINETDDVIQGSAIKGAEHLLLDNLSLESENQIKKPLRKIPLVFIDELENTNEAKKLAKIQPELPDVIETTQEKNKVKPKPKESEQVIKAALTVAEQSEVARQNTSKVLVPTISKISPSPVIGNKKRQWISIKGKHFNKQTIVNLRWEDKGKQRHKLFFVNMDSAQLEWLNPKHLKLHINTGISEKTWHVNLVNQNRESSRYSFKVVAPFESKKVKKKMDKIDAREVNFSGQSSSFYSLQLLGSSNYSSIQKLMNKHQGHSQLSWYKTKRNNKTWYVLIYGRYSSKDKAMQAYKSLPKSLKLTQPWVRKIEGIKQQKNQKKFVAKTKKLDKQPKLKKAKRVAVQTPVIKKDLTSMQKAINQTASDKWAYQLISLSSEAAMKEYINKHGLNKNSKYFERTVNGTKRYTLIYGLFDSERQAKDNINKLPVIIRQGKPWVRSYFDIQKLMK